VQMGILWAEKMVAPKDKMSESRSALKLAV
jgi:hypothetical protein